MRRNDRLDKKSISQLVKLYWSAPGADDAVGPEIERRGVQARDELIQMLDATSTADLDSEMTETAAFILQARFPSPESEAALERLETRRPGPLRGSNDLYRLTMLRAELSGQLNDAWNREDSALPPDERYLHHCELLLAAARPKDRVVFLVQAANAALGDYFIAKNKNNAPRQARTAAKAEQYAREILAIPDLPSKSGDAIYTGHLVLGALANERGDIEAAKFHLIESSKTPGSWSLNRAPGPKWGLAWALAQRGEYDTVCEFLDNVKVFTKWPPCPTPTPKDELMDRWKEIIRAGGIPDHMEWFESNLPKKRRSRAGRNPEAPKDK